MKERPILFSGPMVRAILDGRKTQTRRVCIGQRELSRAADFQISRCPHGQPGDKLWVRETWAVGDIYDKDAPRHLPAPDGECRLAVDYAANDERVWNEYDQGRWRPSIHMPRWASRITLEIESVRVERVQEISEEDAKSEGTPDDALVHYYCEEGNDDDPIGNHRCNWRYGFSRLWDSINLKRGFGWEANPLVWVITFRRVK